jgi:hypothetical protein
MPGVTITRTRTYAADDAGMPLSRPHALALAAQEHRQSRRLSTDEQTRAYLAATGVDEIEHETSGTAEEAYLAATGVPQTSRPAAAGADERDETGDATGDAWVAATVGDPPMSGLASGGLR